MARACGVSSPSERLHCATYHTGLQPFCALHTLSHITHFITHSTLHFTHFTLHTLSHILTCTLHISHFTLHTAQGHCRVFSSTSSHSTATAAHILFFCVLCFCVQNRLQVIGASRWPMQLVNPICRPTSPSLMHEASLYHCITVSLDHCITGLLYQGHWCERCSRLQ